MRQNNMTDAERREERRRRRRRSQAGAYAILAVLIVAAVAGVGFGVRAVVQHMKEETPGFEDESKVNDLLGEEEELVMKPPVIKEPELTEEEKKDELVNAAIEVMTLEDKVAGLFMVTPESITGVSAAVQAGDGTREALNRYAVGGLVYFGKNIQSEEQLKKMLENTELYSRYPVFFGIDEEGGSVSRIASGGLAEGVASAQSIAQTGDVSNAYQAGTTVGTYLSGLGFNLDFAPVADLSNISGSIMKDRSYGADAASAAPFVTSMMQGLEDRGITACLKHFPGIGSTTADTHKQIAVSSRTAEEFRAEELAVFKAGIDAGANMVMVGHIAAPSLTGDNIPCTLSKTVVTDILRNELGFEGVIITDAMNMAAISDYYEADGAAIQALKAGCDMILMPDDFEKAYNGVLQAVKDGVISEERVNDSLRRIYRIKYAGKLD